MLKDKLRILITGAAGTIGKALTQHYLKKEHVVCAFDNNEDGLFRLGREFLPVVGHEKLKLFVGDIRDERRLRYAFDSVDVVIHAAALKHVELSEYNVMDCVDTNVNGTRNVVCAAIDAKVKKVIFTSSDKAVNPTSTMGVTKLLGEKIVGDGNYLVGGKGTIFASVRFGNVLDSNGSVLTIFREKMRAGESFPITDLGMTRFYLTISDAVNLVSDAIENIDGGEIFIKNMGAASIYTLAQAVAGKENIDYHLIGAKPGEKLYEELTTQQEAERTIEHNGILKVLPEYKYCDQATGVPSNLENTFTCGKALSSEEVNLDWKQLRKLLERVR